MIGVSYFLRVLIQPLSTGDRNNLEQDEEKTLKRHAKWSVMNPVHIRQKTVTSLAHRHV
jgi:hypothetical protein